MAEREHISPPITHKNKGAQFFSPVIQARETPGLQRQPEAAGSQAEEWLPELDNILPPTVGLLTHIDRVIMLSDIFGSDLLEQHVRRIHADTDAKRFTRAHGVPGIVALYDFCRGSQLDVPAAEAALSGHPGRYSRDSLRSLRIRPITRNSFRQLVIAEARGLVNQNAPEIGLGFQRVLEGTTAIVSLTTILDTAEDDVMDVPPIEQADFVTQTAARLVRTFILDPGTSSLDLLPEEQRDRFRDFNWNVNDYPGGPRGPNEHRARQMSRGLSEIRPERRPNSREAAVIEQREYTDRVERHIRDNLEPIPAFPAPANGGVAPNQRAGHRLYRNARDAFLAMRAAALADGVPLIVVSSYRDPAVARRRAARAGNPAAVASFSSHSLGLAIDLQMSIDYQDTSGQMQSLSFAETTTRPMQNVADMRESPVHKWVFMHGAAFGWFPYQNEPWHWEYNPEGFRETFHQAITSPVSQEDDIQ